MGREVKSWALAQGQDLVQEVEAVLTHLTKAVENMTVLEGGAEAEQFIEALRDDVSVMADELREKLTMHADLLERCVFVDMNAPDAQLMADIPSQELLPDDET